jgi:hypothetical protein
LEAPGIEPGTSGSVARLVGFNHPSFYGNKGSNHVKYMPVWIYVLKYQYHFTQADVITNYPTN